MVGSVVDSNLINLFQDERAREIEDEAHAALDAIFTNGHIVLDDSEQCQTEWMSCAAFAPPIALADWIADMMQKEKIQLKPLTCGSMHKELTGLGIPKKDHKWVRLAISADSPLIATNDIDLIDPTSKKSGAVTRAKIMASCKGPVSKYLKKSYGINVLCCAKVPAFFA